MSELLVIIGNTHGVRRKRASGRHAVAVKSPMYEGSR
jgi:hypothetical protein